MAFYIRASTWSQLPYLLLALALLALPFVGICSEATPVLAPLATALAPLEAGVQAPPEPAPQIPWMLAAGKVVLASPPLIASLTDFNRSLRIFIAGLWIFSTGALESPTGRSPPDA